MAIDFYFAGTQAPETEDLMVQLNANVLKSYINDRKVIQRFFEFKKNGWKGKLLIDNGAFTVHRQGGTIDIDEYIKWLNDNEPYIDYAIALDEIPGVWGQTRTIEQVEQSALKTYENYIYMRDRVNSPRKLLPVFHQGEAWHNLERFLDIDDLEYMCISGSKDAQANQAIKWFRECFQIIKKSKHPDIKIHFLGSGKVERAETFPITSMDATSWIMTGATGGILTDYGVIYVGDGCKTLNKLPKDAVEKVSKLCESYGLTLKGVGSDYKQRMLFNIHYIVEIMNRVEYVQTDVHTRRLF